jgi:hypothetical protein
LVLQAAPREGISLLSGVASDTDLLSLVTKFSHGELVYMLNTVQETLHAFTSSGARRVDTELCILNLCQPELSTDADAINARISKLEEQLKNGSFTVKASPIVYTEPEEELPPVPGDEDAPPAENEAYSDIDEGPVGFWTDLVTELRKELKPPALGFFTLSTNAPVTGVLKGDVLELRCSGCFVAQMLDKPETTSLIASKASAKAGRKLRVAVVDITANPGLGHNMSQLLDFGRAHSDIIRIKDNNR